MRLPLFAVILLRTAAIAAAPVERLSDFELTDQNAKTRSYRFPKAKVTVMTVADHKGSDQLAPWIQALHDRYRKRIDIDGLADVSMIPKLFHGMFREALMAADACANIHLDTSSSNSWIRYTPGLTLEAVFRTAVAVAGARRLLFGTDSSFFPRGWQRGIYDAEKQALSAMGASAEDQTLVFGGNFDRLFPPRAA